MARAQRRIHHHRLPGCKGKGTGKAHGKGSAPETPPEAAWQQGQGPGKAHGKGLVGYARPPAAAMPVGGQGVGAQGILTTIASSTLSSSTSSTGPVLTLPQFHLTRTVLPGYRFPPPFNQEGAAMPYSDHRKMVDPTYVAP